MGISLYFFFFYNGCRAIQKSNCYHKEGHRAACGYGHTSYMLFFGIVQTVLSQIPNFRDTKWLSIIAAIMSFTYSIIGSALGLQKVIGLVNNMLRYDFTVVGMKMTG